MNHELRMSRTWTGAKIILCGMAAAAFLVGTVVVTLHRAESIEQSGRRGDEARVKLTLSIMRIVEQTLDLFQLDHGAYPERLEDLVKAPNYVDAKKYPADSYLKEIPTDGWGNKLIYRRISSAKGFELISYGMDGKEGGDGYDADIVK